MDVGKRRHTQVAQPGGAGTDDDDLSLEFVGGTRALRAVEVLVQVDEGDVGELVGPAPPGENDVVRIRQRKAEIRRDPGRRAR